MRHMQPNFGTLTRDQKTQFTPWRRAILHRGDQGSANCRSRSCPDTPLNRKTGRQKLFTLKRVLARPLVGVWTLVLAGSAATFANADPSAIVANDVESTAQVSRIYLVRNSNSSLIALREEQLDKPAAVRRLGNALNVWYRGAKSDVETTIVVRGNSITVLDRYLPTDDLDE